MLEACVRSRLLYTAQSWELSASELRKLETIWLGFSGKLSTTALNEKNVPQEYLKARKAAQKSNTTVLEPDDLNWAYVFSNEKLHTITKTCNITYFCKIQHLNYVAHVTRLDNCSFKKKYFSRVNTKNMPVIGGTKWKNS